MKKRRETREREEGTRRGEYLSAAGNNYINIYGESRVSLCLSENNLDECNHN